MPGARPDGTDKNKDGTDSSLRKPDAENLSRSVTDTSFKENKTEKKQAGKDAKQSGRDVVIVDDQSADRFLAASSVQSTLANHVTAIGNVAKQDPTTAQSYPQWADWHADQNEAKGEVEAAKQMKEQSKKARKAIEEGEKAAKTEKPSEQEST